jgi:hypothetical protein
MDWIGWDGMDWIGLDWIDGLDGWMDNNCFKNVQCFLREALLTRT